jgi:hypothetical protein
MRVRNYPLCPHIKRILRTGVGGSHRRLDAAVGERDVRGFATWFVVKEAFADQARDGIIPASPLLGSEKGLL